MHPPCNSGTVSYHISQNNLGAWSPLAFVALQHPPCPTRNYRRYKVGVPVRARLRRGHLPLSAAACLVLFPPLSSRRLATVSAGKMSNVASSRCAAAKLRTHSSIPKQIPPFPRTVPVDGRPEIKHYLPFQDTAGAFNPRRRANFKHLLPSRKQ